MKISVKLLIILETAFALPAFAEDRCDQVFRNLPPLIGGTPLNDLADGSFVTVIWNPLSGQIFAVPSRFSKLNDGQDPRLFVNRRGGHAQLARMMIHPFFKPQFRGGGFLKEGKDIVVFTKSRGTNPGTEGQMEKGFVPEFARAISHFLKHPVRLQETGEIFKP